MAAETQKLYLNIAGNRYHRAYFEEQRRESRLIQAMKDEPTKLASHVFGNLYNPFILNLDFR